MIDLLAILVGAVVVVMLIITFLGLQFIPLRFWFAGIALFALPQVYLFPVAGVYPSLSLLACLGALFSFKVFPEFFRLTWVKALVALMFVQLTSIAWSQSPVAGVRYLIYLLPFLMAAFVGFTTARSDFSFARRLIVVALWLSVIQALLVILFRLVPSAEAAFIASRIAGIATSPNVLSALFDGSPNNIFDIAKSGGLFVNANTASAILGFYAMLAWHLGRNDGMRSLRMVAFINWVAVFFTGSKAGAILGVFIPGALLLLDVLRKRRIDMRIAALLAFGGAAAIVIVPFAVERFLESDFVGATSSTLDVRQVIWSFARQEFIHSPIKGMGFGGWEARFPIYAFFNRVSPNYPPHNAFMILWSQSGLIAVFCMAAFVGFFLQWVFKAGYSKDVFVRNLGTGLFFGALWFWLQAQGENFGILGEQHFTPLLGLLSGVLYARLQTNSRPETAGQTMEIKS